MTSIKSINIVFEIGKYHSWPANTHPFGSGIEEQIPTTPGRIQVRIPAVWYLLNIVFVTQVPAARDVLKTPH